MADKTPETRPNSNPSEEFLGKVGEVMRKLERGERITLEDVGAMDRIRAEKFMEKRRENLNLAIRISEKIKIRSGGYEIQIKDNRVIVYGKDGGVVHEYVNECLTKNVINLLMAVLAKYGVSLSNDRWYAISLPRQDHDVRKLQSWILALLTNFSKPLKNNPMICS